MRICQRKAALKPSSTGRSKNISKKKKLNEVLKEIENADLRFRR